MAAYGELLAAARQAAGLSQHALAKAAGVDASYVNRLERGERQPPDPDLTRRFAAALALDPAILLLADLLADPALPAPGRADLRRVVEIAASLLRSGRLGPALLLADLLADPAIPDPERADLARIVALLARRWRPDVVAD